MLLPPTVDELAAFAGRPVTSFSEFASMALAQSTLMFATLTKLTAYPADPDQVTLASYAIMEMADRILLEQPYAQVKSSPFQSETIGSYTYSKSAPSVKTALQGSRTGLFWWDVAIDELSVPGSSVLAHGSIGVCVDGLYVRGDGQVVVLDEVQAHGVDRPPYVRIS